MKPKALFLLFVVLWSSGIERSYSAENNEALILKTRQRVEVKPGEWEIKENSFGTNPKSCAIIVCDMWDDHWCKGAARRVAEMAPRMNEVIKAARKRGLHIIHAPSDTMKFYEGTVQRENAKKAPYLKPPKELTRWMHIDPAKEAALPIDDSDGGCDDEPKCKQGPPYPWTRQIATIEIAPEDTVSSDGQEIWNVLHEKQLGTVIVMGVHANMCVLGRPFSIRQLVSLRKHVLLMRDMTDTMYNSRMKPLVNHFTGNDLMVEHIEKYWCASITSDSFIGGKPFKFKEDQRKTVAFIIGEDEYNTKATLPEFALKELPSEDFKSFFVHAQESDGNNFPGLETIKEADLLVISVRRRTPLTNQLNFIRQHVREGKPVIGIRTASHAFDAKPPGEQHGAWSDFDTQILGYKYEGHFGNSVPKGPPTIVKPIAEAITHPIMTGIEPADFKSTSHLYKNRRSANTLTPLLNGLVEGKSEEHPVAWVHTGFNRKVFYTSLGNPDDFKLPQFRAMLKNAFYWSLDLPIPGRGNNASQALTPEQAQTSFKIPDDLEWELVLAETVVRQPVYLSFDERGRMWVVQYLQYPHPAGLKIVSKDNFWRAVYDKVPRPPPNHFQGADKITIHEDTDGDGKFDKHKTFVEGLNIATAVVSGRGGAWVLNPPYLLFYPDKNGDDVPDASPEVHLQGFGLEDTHSVINSLRWGPDGWLYAAQGSTVTASVTQPGSTNRPVSSMGQLIWRYHPESRRYEVFSESGGNAFGVEIDAKGRIFSGNNGGNTRGFHYAQGAYLQKGFEKHGLLSNHYSYGYFPPMPHPDVERFTHNFIIYESHLLPAKYQGKLFGIEPLQGRVVLSDIVPDKSSFRTIDLSHPVTTSDPWFKPVDIKEGPDGAIYVCDWYDRQVNHFRNHEGQLDTNNGRIYRLKPNNTRLTSHDLSKLTSAQLVEVLKEPARARRQMAQKILADRADAKLIQRLEEILANERGQTALEALWALNASGGFTAESAGKYLNHSEPFVRAWAVRLIGDQPKFWEGCAGELAKLAAQENKTEVRGQLASTAKRLPTPAGVPIIANLLAASSDSSDNRQPLLLWWALEQHADSVEAAALFDNATFWRQSLVHDHIASRFMRRFAQRGSRDDLLLCARLLKLSPSPESSGKLLEGFEAAYRGRPLTGLPSELAGELAKFSARYPALALRSGNKEAIAKALSIVQDSSSKKDLRSEYLQILGELKEPQAVPHLLSVIQRDKELRRVALSALGNYNDSLIGFEIVKLLPQFDLNERQLAVSLLSTRPEWSVAMLDSKEMDKREFPPDIVAKLKASPNTQISSLAKKIFPSAPGGPNEAKIGQLKRAIMEGSGNPYEGQKHYSVSCAPCHKLFGQGGEIGPELTSYNRSDLDSLLLSIISPSAEIREGYNTHLVYTKDQRSLSGFVADEDDRTLVLRTVAGETLVVEKAAIERNEAVGVSLMPEGLLDGYDSQGVRDLFAYLRSRQHLPR